MKYLLLVLSFFLFFQTASKAQRIYRKELLGKPTASEISIQLFFADSVELRVQYGTSSGTYTNQTNWQLAADSVPAEIQLTGLLADTK